MKTAAEVKSIAVTAKAEKTANELAHIHSMIEKAAEDGNLRIAVKVKHNPTEQIVSQIQQLGYVVTQEAGLIVIDWS